MNSWTVSYMCLVIILCLFFCVNSHSLVQFNMSVTLLSHVWCRKCDKAISILQKLKLNYQSGQIQSQQSPHFQNQISFQILNLEQDFLSDTASQQILNNETIRTLYSKIQQKYQIASSELPFPTIWIQCPYFSGIYQHQLIYQQLSYWIDVLCLKRIPHCPAKVQGKKEGKKVQYLIEINSDCLKVQQNKKKIVQWNLAYPFAKLCLIKKDSSENNSLELDFDGILGNLQPKLTTKPLFFTHFTHNIRSYFFNTFDSKINKAGIFLVFNSASHPKVKQFIDFFKYLSDQCNNGNNDYHLNQGKLKQIFYKNQSHRLQLESEYHKSGNLQSQVEFLRQKVCHKFDFVTACYSDNKQDCVLNYEYLQEQNKDERAKDPSIKPLINKYKILFPMTGTKIQNIKRLMQFGRIKNTFEQFEVQGQRTPIVKIVAFHFNPFWKTIKGFEFLDSSTKLGQNFIFWLQKVSSQIFDKRSHDRQQKGSRNACLSSQLIHVISERNLTSIKNNIQITKMVRQMNTKKINKLRFQTLILEKDLDRIPQADEEWKYEYFLLCVQDQSLIKTSDLNQIKMLISNYFDKIEDEVVIDKKEQDL